MLSFTREYNDGWLGGDAGLRQNAGQKGRGDGHAALCLAELAMFRRAGRMILNFRALEVEACAQVMLSPSFGRRWC